MNRMADFNPAELSTTERYKLLIGSITPRPIGFISTLGPKGPNLAPYSFFNACGSSPMMLMFCPANTPEGEPKDSFRNALREGDHPGAGQFVVNLASERYIRQVAGAAENLPEDESEFDLVGLTPEPSSVVAPPRVAESPVCFECETWRVIRTNENEPDAPMSGNIVIGKVVHVRIHDDAVNEKMHVDPDALETIGRMGGMNYCTTRDRFELPIGRPALES